MTKEKNHLFKKGHKVGRPKGRTNKVTANIRQAFQNLIELNTPNMIKWLERVAEEDPAKALSLCGDLAEYCIPKLSRTEIKEEITIEHIDTMILKLEEKLGTIEDGLGDIDQLEDCSDDDIIDLDEVEDKELVE